MKGLISTRAWRKSARWDKCDGTIPVMAEWLKIDKEMAAAIYDSSVKTYRDDLNLPDGGLRLLIDEAKRVAKVSREVSSSEVADLSILKQAQNELGIGGR